MIRANDERSPAITRYGAYVCVTISNDEARRALASGDIAASVSALATRLELKNEFDVGDDGHPRHAVGFVRRVDATPGATAEAIADEALLRADAVVHVASADADRVDACRDELLRLIGSAGGTRPRVLEGVVRPTNYTSNEMHNYAYAHQVLQQSGRVMPHAFLLPTSKTAAWWAKDWLERHTYFLPRYDDDGRMVREGHVLAASPGIAGLMRRTYKSATQPAAAGAYDFVNYFECADADVPTFHAVCAALRDVERNPEWRFVREGPTWHGRRVATWPELFRS